MTWQDVAKTVRPVLNQAASDVITVIVRSLDYSCWKCERTSTPPVVLHPLGYADQYSTLDATSGLNLAYVQELITLDRNPIAETIKPRYSKTRGERYLSHGCQHCDALFGEFPLQESITSALASDAIGELRVELEIDRPVLEWWELMCTRGGTF